jgi:hypothetical protein
MGNAIVVKRVGTTRAWRSDPESVGIPLDDEKALTLVPVWQVETDFGNIAKLTEHEIRSNFFLGYIEDYDRWWDRRLELIKKGV